MGSLIGTQLVAGCVSTTPKQETVEPFLFRSLDLRQQDGKGLPAWSLTSPEARYDINRTPRQGAPAPGPDLPQRPTPL
jgi:hypothetical protein